MTAPKDRLNADDEQDRYERELREMAADTDAEYARGQAERVDGITGAELLETPDDDPRPVVGITTTGGQHYEVAPDYPIDQLAEAITPVGGHGPAEAGHPTTAVDKATSTSIVLSVSGVIVAVLLVGVIATMLLSS